jgi:hypothetical protein
METRMFVKEWWENPERFWFNAYSLDSNQEWANGWCFGKTQLEAVASAILTINSNYPRVKGNRKLSLRQDCKNPVYFDVNVILK